MLDPASARPRLTGPEGPKTRLIEQLRLAAANGRYEEEGLRVRKDGSVFWA